MPYYAVRVGRKPGVYVSWEACKAQTHGFKGAVYKKFESKAEAEAFIGDEAQMPEVHPDVQDLPAGVCVAYVDGSFNAKTKQYGYGVVFFSSRGKEDFYGSGSGEGARHRNVAGEILGAEVAMDVALERGAQKLTIVHDYAGIRHWAMGEWKANLPMTQAYRAKAETVRHQLDLRFQKVAAHTGVEWNEEADRLAKRGAGI